MAKRKPAHSEPCAIDRALRRVVTIGQLEALAGIGRSHAERFDFWIRFKNLPTEEVIPAGGKVLRQMIAERVNAGVMCLIPTH